MNADLFELLLLFFICPQCQQMKEFPFVPSLFYLRDGLPFSVTALQSKASCDEKIQGDVELIERCHLFSVSLNWLFEFWGSNTQANTGAVFFPAVFYWNLDWVSQVSTAQFRFNVVHMTSHHNFITVAYFVYPFIFWIVCLMCFSRYFSSFQMSP